MGTSNAHPARVGWFEITATEPSRSREFYRELFGWTFDAFGSGDAYCTITAPGAGMPMGALRRGDRDALCIGVLCSDAWATIRTLEPLGATLAEEPARTPAGDIHAVVLDGQGNRLGLLEPAAPTARPEPRAAPGPNATAFFEIGTTDLAATRRFCQEAFGWSTERDEAAEGVAYYSIQAPGLGEIGGVLDLSGMDGVSDYAIPGLRVADATDVLERAEAAGGSAVMGPVSDANGLVIVQFLDPAGNRWSAFALPTAE
ncbi:VOC family protein [Streptomyces ovatisporus]|uniref:VOC family protein n=1 Tax=Streptomyces ovatisporus TaxID=1128682 RepID=A0ABV9A660_9ACTN